MSRPCDFGIHRYNEKYPLSGFIKECPPDEKNSNELIADETFVDDKSVAHCVHQWAFSLSITIHSLHA